MATPRYDVIVVGARVAGAATAMLLARRGLRVLAVDRARFPSDTLSTHQLQVPGVALLNRWGLLERLVAAGTPATRGVRFDAGDVVLDGRFPSYGGANALYSPRRTLLDSMLVEAARAAGAEVRENYLVNDLVWEGSRVVGIRGHERHKTPMTETARLVVGADGKHSLVADAVGAHRYREQPASTLACYTYWSGVQLTRGELYQRPGRAVAAFPTNDGLTMVYVAAPRTDLAAFRTDIESHYLKTPDLCSDLGERVRAGERAERFRTTPDLPNTFRIPCGPGWALVGDAGVVLDPITAQGIGNALRDADLLAGAIGAGLDDSGSLDARLSDYQQRRDAAVGPMYDFTVGVAAMRPPRLADRQLLASLQGRQAEIDRFIAVFAGVISPADYRSPRNLARVLGVRGLARVAAAGVLSGRRIRPRTALAAISRSWSPGRVTER